MLESHRSKVTESVEACYPQNANQLKPANKTLTRFKIYKELFLEKIDNPSFHHGLLVMKEPFSARKCKMINFL